MPVALQIPTRTYPENMKRQKSAFKIKMIENSVKLDKIACLKFKMFDGLLKNVCFKICYEKKTQMILNSYLTDLSQDINHPLHNYYILKAIFKFFSKMYMKCINIVYNNY